MEQHKREQFISGYIKRQEELLIESIKARIEAEVNSSIRVLEMQQLEEVYNKFKEKALQDDATIENLTEKIAASDAMQIKYEEDINSLRADLDEQKKRYEQDAATHLAAIIQVKDERTRFMNDMQTYKNNYDIVNNAHNELIATSKQEREAHNYKMSNLMVEKIDIEQNYKKLKDEHEKLLVKYKEIIELLDKSKKKQTSKKITDWEDSSIIN